MSPVAIFNSGDVMRPRSQRGWIGVRGAKRKYYYGRYYVYVKGENGKDVRRHTGAFLGWKSDTSLGEAREKLQRIIFEKCGKVARPSDAVTLAWFYANRFEPMRRGNWGEPTRRGNESDMRRYVRPQLGEIPLRDFDLFRCQVYLNALAAQRYSEALVRRCKTLLWSIFDVAVELEFLAKNPMARVDFPKCKPIAKPTIQKADIYRLLQSVADTRDRLILMLGIFAGIRASEVFGLQWDCFRGDHIEIRNTAWNGELYQWRVKRKASFRRVHLSPQTQRLFEKWKAGCANSSPDALVFPGKSGKPMWSGIWLQKHIQPIAKRLGITVPITFQVFRRSCTTRNQKHGSLKDVQVHMGHGSIETTGDVYMQEIPESVTRMVELDEMDVLGPVQ
jgi:integrase